jgi:hypothetical protein
MKTWMVEGFWKLPNGMSIPVRSVVEAKTRKQAAKSADAAVFAAVQQLTNSNSPPGQASGKAQVLYAVG